uniref:Putative surface protein n=1 Tax=Aster yellows phytoplasma TaxID=35779 RepID=Q847R2_ASTYP|nr:putative surface protein [Aster yellows phytoplasma]
MIISISPTTKSKVVGLTPPPYPHQYIKV